MDVPAVEDDSLVLAGLKPRRFAPTPLGGAAGLDAGSAQGAWRIYPPAVELLFVGIRQLETLVT